MDNLLAYRIEAEQKIIELDTYHVDNNLRFLVDI